MITRILDTDLDSEKRYVQNLVYIIYMYILYMIFRTCTLLQSTTGPMDPGLGKNRKTHLTNMLNDLQLSNENKKQKKTTDSLLKLYFEGISHDFVSLLLPNEGISHEFP